MSRKKGLFIGSLLPTENKPEAGIFFYKLIFFLNKDIAETYVIYPKKINFIFKDRFPKEMRTIFNFSSRPYYLSLGFLRHLKHIYKYINLICFFTFFCAIKRSYNKLIFKGFIKPDFVYSHFISPAGIAAAMISFEKNIPCFVAVGESSLKYLNNLPKNFLKKYLNKIDIFISVNSKNARILKEDYLIKESKIIIIPNAPDRKIFFKKNFFKCREKLNFNLKKKYILFVGSLTKRKGFDIYLKLAIKNPNFNFIAIGRDSEKIIPKIKNIGNISCIGPQSQEIIADYMNASNLFAFFSRQEGSPNALLEAKATNLPILCSDIDEHRELLGSDNAFYTSLKKLEYFDDLNMIFKSEKYKILGQNSKVDQETSFEKRAEKILKIIYKNLKK